MHHYNIRYERLLMMRRNHFVMHINLIMFSVDLYDELDKPVVIDEIVKAVKSPQRDKAFGNGHLSNENLSNLLIYCHHI